MARPRLSSVLAMLAALDCAALVSAQQPAAEPTSGTDGSGKEWLRERQAEFEQYEFTAGEGEPVKLSLESRSLLNWTNAERGAYAGAVYLWTYDGLPQVVACAFGRGKYLRHEFHSLSTVPILLRRGEEEIHRFEPGIVWQELADAPPPAKPRTLRLTQMRRQAERFRVVMGGKDPAEMRLLTQPIFRSPAEGKDDVALFAFVQGTDPECLLLLRAASDGKWQYALTRQTKWPVVVELDGNQAAEFPSVGKTPPGSPFFVLAPPSAQE
jgi:hypothetical protein